MFVVGDPTYTTIKACIVEIRISNDWVFHPSDLKRRKAVQVTEREQFH